MFTFDLITKKWTAHQITKTNFVDITILPKSANLLDHQLLLELQSHHINKKIRINQSTFSLFLPIAELYNFSLYSKDILINNFSLDVKTMASSSSHSFLECKTTDVSPRCWIYNSCINQSTFEFFGYNDIDFDINFSVLLNPNANPVKLSITRVPGEPSSMSDITSILADINSTGVFYHSTIEAVYPLLTLIVDENILYQPKLLILQRKSNTNFAQLHFLNLSVTTLTSRQCFKKILVGLPKSRSSTYKLRHLLPNIYTQKYRTHYRNVYYNYLYHNVDYPPTKTKYILFLNRPRRTHRSILNHEALMASLVREFPNYVVSYTDLTGLDIKRQMDLILRTDILVAIHGSGLAHMMLLKDTALIIEIAPYLFGYHCNLFGDLANTTNLKLAKVTLCRNSTFPVKVNLMNELEKNPRLFLNFPHRQNIRDSNLILNNSEIDSVIKIIQNYN